MSRKTYLVFASLLTLLLVVSAPLYGCSQEDTASKFAGTWKITGFQSNGDTVPVSELDESQQVRLGIVDALMTLTKDGSGELRAGNESEKARWRKTDVGIVVNDTVLMTDGDKLLVLGRPIVLVFEKTSSSTSSTEKAYSASSGRQANEPEPIYPPGAIEWTSARQHVGETITLYGKVVDAEYASTSSGQPTFLDIGASYPSTNRLSVVIWGDDRASFPSAPEKMYADETVAVTGKVYMYDGVCNIEVSSPSQIEIIQ